jgi:hypothetical protein
MAQFEPGAGAKELKKKITNSLPSNYKIRAQNNVFSMCSDFRNFSQKIEKNYFV